MNATRNACHDVMTYMASRRVTLNRTRLLLGLSGVATGLDQIASGKVEQGERVARHGLEFVKGMLGERE